MPINPGDPTSDIGMMYRNYLQSRGQPLTSENMQRVVAQSQHEPGMFQNGQPSTMIPGLTVEQADTPQNLAGASPNNSGNAPPLNAGPMPKTQPLPIPPQPPVSAPPSMAATGAQPQGGIGSDSTVDDVLKMLGLGGGATLGALIARATGKGGPSGISNGGAMPAGRAAPPPMGQWGVDVPQPAMSGSGQGALPGTTPPPGQAPIPQQALAAPQEALPRPPGSLPSSVSEMMDREMALEGPRPQLALPSPQQRSMIPTRSAPPDVIHGQAPDPATAPIGNILHDKGPTAQGPQETSVGGSAPAGGDTARDIERPAGSTAEKLDFNKIPMQPQPETLNMRAVPRMKAPRVRGLRIP